MSYQTEFPALYAVTKMYPDILRLVGDNLEYYSVDVRIDYERWVCFEKEYGEWADRQAIFIGQDSNSPSGIRR